ncbi:MAG: response regulator transcription factor [Candidatus Caenarcaniphilales bacterium]|nr:response regulator transcription factor [Candidatus Caenarcaniphilales bacterium]
MDESLQILIIDDDPNVHQVLAFALLRDGLKVISAYNTKQAHRCLVDEKVDLVILDVLMPGQSGTAFCKDLREKAASKIAALPILFLSSLSDEEDRVLGLEIGGDDYMTKPFSPKEVVTKVKAMLRRSCFSKVSHEATLIEKADLKLNSQDYSLSNVSADDNKIALTLTEFALLELLMNNYGNVVSKDTLSRELYAGEVAYDDQRIKNHIKRLRAKLKKINSNTSIEAVYGVGFKMV